MPSTGATGYDSTAAQAAPDASVTDFTFIVNVANLSASFKSALSAYGSSGGIRVFDSGGSTEYARDPINVDHSAGTGWIRFQVPGATSSAITVRIYPDATGSYAATDTYGQHNAYASAFAMYLPLDGSSLLDRTANDVDGTAQGGFTYGTGKVGGAGSMDGTGDYASFTDPSWSHASWTISAWVNNSKTSAQPVIMRLGSHAFQIITNGSANWTVRYYNGTSNFDWTTSSSASTWTHLAITKTGSTATLYINGVSDGTKTISVNLPGILRVGSYSGGTQNDWGGLLDEIKAESAARSVEWVNYEYDQTDDNAAFWGTWTWTAAAAGGQPFRKRWGGVPHNGYTRRGVW